MLRKIYIFSSLVLVIFACKSLRITDPLSYPGEQIILGSGGGATGIINTWYVYDNGQIFQQEGVSGELKYIKKLNKNSTKEAIKSVMALELDKQNFNHPGNMTKFISFRRPGITYTVKWGDPAFNAPEQYNDVYKKIMGLIQSK